MNNQKKFGVWMDSHHATIVGDSGNGAGKTEILAHVKGETVTKSSGEKNANNHEKTALLKFFKEISFHLQNATHIHVTGTGQAQEQFIHYLASTPQFKDTKTDESTSNKMSDEKLLSFLADKN
ncbi:MAG: hypothetical protein ABI402_08170 [Ferruginibacter sp.]